MSEGTDEVQQRNGGEQYDEEIAVIGRQMKWWDGCCVHAV